MLTPLKQPQQKWRASHPHLSFPCFRNLCVHGEGRDLDDFNGDLFQCFECIFITRKFLQKYVPNLLKLIL